MTMTRYYDDSRSVYNVGIGYVLKYDLLFINTPLLAKLPNILQPLRSPYQNYSMAIVFRHCCWF